MPGKYEERLTLDLPAGIYEVAWVEPATGNVLDTKRIRHAGGTYSVSAPSHSADMALRIKRQHVSGR
jgi:hypothetical protein